MRAALTQIAKLAVPTVIITLVLAVYNMADIFFIGKTGNTDMVNAISVCMPIFTLVQAFGTLVGTGGCTAISIALGKNENARTRSISAFCCWFCIALGLMLAVAMNVFANGFLSLLGASASYSSYAITYLRIIAFGCPIMLFTNAFVNILRADGSIKESMIANLAGTIANIILDPVLIFGFDMGVAGAAIATVIGNLLSLVIVLAVIRKKSQILSFDIKCVSLKAENSLEILGLGVPVAAGTLLISAAYMVMNNILKGYDANAQGAFGICRTIMLMSTMIQMGICMGVQPAVSYNYGTKDAKRVKDLIAKTGIVSMAFGAAVSIICICMRKPILAMFLKDQSVMIYAEKNIVGCLCTAVFFAIYQTCATSLQAIEKPLWSTIITLLRQGIVLIPSMFILNAFWGFDGLVFCFAAADIISAAVGVMLTRRRLQQIA